ncbi:MAG: TonB-dependent receptor [Ferruginibacter sp.]|nr:TonB-dependent receptor [Cytophagales bacterium]
MRHLVPVVLAFLVPLPELHAQTAVIEGKIVDQSEKQPLEFATVALHRSADSTLVGGVVSDADGHFRLEKLSAGRYYLAIGFLGYDSRKVAGVNLAADQQLNLGTVPLSAGQQLLDELIVRGEKATSYHKIDKQVYNAARFGSSQGGTATDVLRNLPSVAVNGEGEVTVRGSGGFTVLIDGKPVQSDATTILSQLPANSIENVEVITAPSSKYDPDGKAGILNITTKKGTTNGLYLVTNAQVGLPSVETYGNAARPRRFGGDFTANYRKDRWDLSLGANYKRDDIAGYRDGEAETDGGSVRTTFPSLGERSYRNYTYALRATAAYQINPRHSVAAGFYGGKRTQYRRADLLYRQRRADAGTGAPIDALDFFNKNLRERKSDFAIANLDYTRRFADRSTLTLSGLYEKTQLGGPTDNRNVKPADESQLINRSLMEEDNPLDGFRFKADYVRPVGKQGRLEAGYQYRYLLHRGEFRYLELDLGTGAWLVRPDLSNAIRLTRHIHSGYGQYADRVGKLNYSAGLRLEYTDRVLNDASTPAPYVFERWNLFPSVNLLYDLGRSYQLKAGYSRRITHTTTNEMNPFPARRHSEVLEVGDPTLLPEYTDAAELGGIKSFGNGSLFANFYHRGTRHVINRVNSVYSDTILNRTYTNAGQATAWGLELGTDLKLTKWWNWYAGGNAYRYAIEGAVFNREVNRRGFNYSFNVNTTFRLRPTLSLQGSVNYLSRTVTAQGEDSRLLLPAATLRKILLDGRASLSLQWANIDLGWLGSNQQRIATRGDGFYSSTNYIQEVDIFRINFSYQLNKLARKVKFTESEFGEKEF